MKYRNVILRHKNFIICHQYDDKYLIINTKKDFEYGHTHVYGLAYAKLIVFTLSSKRLKQKHSRLLKNNDFIKSMERLTSKQYVDKLIMRSTF